jgi:uncharacterized protein (DUF983 family)
MFQRGLRLLDRCQACGLRYLHAQGDTWFFWLLGNRFPIAIGIVAVYFGFHVDSVVEGVGFVIALLIPLLLSMRPRQGIAVALAYLARFHMPDPSDEMPGFEWDEASGRWTPRGG